MKTRSALSVLIKVLFIFSLSASLATRPTDQARIQLVLDSSEAEQVLGILALRLAGKPVEESDWHNLFSTEPYMRLKKREAWIAERFHDPSRVFSDEDFKKFVLSVELLRRAPELRRTLEEWKKADLQGTTQRVLGYLPDSAVIRAKVFPVIKPGTNSFVFETNTDPAIFLYLDPGEPAAKFENTVAHELHHIGIGSVQTGYEEKLKSLAEPARAAAEWMGAFAEGQAMLAAAGGPDVDPHAASTAAERERWSHDLANFNADLSIVNTFFLGVLHGRFATPGAIEEKASSFYGLQGPWYTVGYKMSVMVEKRFGRKTLIETMLDPRRLLLLYNQTAAEQNSSGKTNLPLWSTELLDAVKAAR